MKCLRCGAWTRVLETRHHANVVNRRTRICGNGHRFPTYEVPASVYIDGKRRLPAIERGVAARAERRARDHQVNVLARQGLTNEAIAAKVGVTEAGVRYIRKRDERKAS